MNKNQTYSKAFTIVELTVIIIVVAILASLTLVSYNWVRIQAAETAMRADLQSAETTLLALKGANKNYPVTAEQANNGKGLLSSSGNELLYIGGTSEFCLVVKNAATQSTYHLTKTSRTPIAGSCGPFVGTIAGTGARYSGSGYADGSGTAARFSTPQGMVMDNSGDIYIADPGNRRIRKMTQAGIVTTYAGSGTIGSLDGPKATAEFRWPGSIALDNSGNMYVSDEENHTIRKITAGGTVSTLAGGNGVPGFADASGLSARFDEPAGLDTDASGNIYVADKDNNRIRRITPAGAVTTFAGSGTYAHTDGTGIAAAFANPWDVEIDGSGNLFVTDNNSVRKITPAGVVTTVAGVLGSGQVDGTGSAALFDWPTGITIDKVTGNLYVVDKSSGQIRKVTQAGVVTTLAGIVYEWDAIDGPGLGAAFAWPDDVVISSKGVLYISDTDNSKIRLMIE